VYIVRLNIERFRSICSATLFPGLHNVYLGPNNIGKTAILEALNLLLNPEIGTRGGVVDENDFYRREYRLPPAEVCTSATNTTGDSTGPDGDTSDGEPNGGTSGISVAASSNGAGKPVTTTPPDPATPGAGYSTIEPPVLPRREGAGGPAPL